MAKMAIEKKVAGALRTAHERINTAEGKLAAAKYSAVAKVVDVVMSESTPPETPDLVEEGKVKTMLATYVANLGKTVEAGGKLLTEEQRKATNQLRRDVKYMIWQRVLPADCKVKTLEGKVVTLGSITAVSTLQHTIAQAKEACGHGHAGTGNDNSDNSKKAKARGTKARAEAPKGEAANVTPPAEVSDAEIRGFLRLVMKRADGERWVLAYLGELGYTVTKAPKPTGKAKAKVQPTA